MHGFVTSKLKKIDCCLLLQVNSIPMGNPIKPFRCLVSTLSTVVQSYYYICNLAQKRLDKWSYTQERYYMEQIIDIRKSLLVAYIYLFDQLTKMHDATLLKVQAAKYKNYTNCYIC